MFFQALQEGCTIWLSLLSLPIGYIPEMKNTCSPHRSSLC